MVSLTFFDDLTFNDSDVYFLPIELCIDKTVETVQLIEFIFIMFQASQFKNAFIYWLRTAVVVTNRINLNKTINNSEKPAVCSIFFRQIQMYLTFIPWQTDEYRSNDVRKPTILFGNKVFNGIANNQVSNIFDRFTDK